MPDRLSSIGAAYVEAAVARGEDPQVAADAFVALVDEHEAARDAARNPAPVLAPTATAPAPVSDRTAAARAAMAARQTRASDAEAARELLVVENTATREMVEAMSDDEAMYASRLEERPLSAEDKKIKDDNDRYNADPRAEMVRMGREELRTRYYSMSPGERASNAAAVGVDLKELDAEMAAKRKDQADPGRRDRELAKEREQS